MLGEDDATVREFLHEYLRRTAAQIEQLGAALNSANAVQVELLAHRSRGASANFGVDAMIYALERLEEAARAGDLSNGRHLLAGIEQAFALVQKTIQAEFEKHRPRS